MDCVKKTLEKAGFEGAAHLRLTDHGFEKGASPAMEENLQKVLELARPLLA